MELEKLIEQYYVSIDMFDSEVGICSILPGPEHANYLELMNGLIDKINKNMAELLAYSQTEEVDKDELLEMLKEYQSKREELERKLERDLKIESELKEIIFEQTQRIIFAQNESGKSIIIKDLENILKNGEKELKESFRKLFQRLQSKEVGYNEVKNRAITNNNKLKGLFEVKEYQARIYYQYVNNYIVIIGANQKKSDNDKIDHLRMINAKKQTSKFIEYIDKNAYNETLLSMLEKEANDYIEEFCLVKNL